MKTEHQLREEEVITPKSVKELTKYINDLVKQKHDYGTCVYAMSMAATAAFNYVSSELGVSGFQASCADMDFIRRSRGIKGPFMIVDLYDELYESGRTVQKVKEAVNQNRTWLMKEARKCLAESNSACDEVYSRWIELAYGYLTIEQRLQWDEENPENKIDEAWLQDNAEKYDFYSKKMEFATADFTPEFIKAKNLLRREK